MDIGKGSRVAQLEDQIRRMKEGVRANEQQVGGDHYKKHGDRQHWDVVHHFNLDYFQGQITKYVMRWRDKGGVNDLRKARHFLDKYIELASEEIVVRDVENDGSEPGPGYVNQG